jgi:fibrillarin-like pre-rRNA processing protein
MRPALRPRPHRSSPRLGILRVGEREELWTQTVGSFPAVYGERWTEFQGLAYRSFDPFRSKLAAAISRGWTGDLPAPGESWLYLGAASGTTASHVADLIDRTGRLYAIERSPRPVARLLEVAERWPNFLPILADAREPRTYSDLVPPVDGVYADVAQPDQVEIVRRNAELFLRGPGGRVLVALKTASMGRELGPAGHLRRAETALGDLVDLRPSVKLDPFHRAHYLVGGRARSRLFGGSGPAGATRSPAPLRVRPRP